MKHTTDTPQLSVIARAPFTVYYEGLADSISAANKVGPFDILPGHADFFSMLIPGDITIRPQANAEPITFYISDGIITVRDNEVMLFANM